jgi:UDP-N-acetylglucosamine 2-epimerase
VIKTGSPLREVLEFYRPKFAASTILDQHDLHPLQYYVVSTHREENGDSPARLRNWADLLSQIALHTGLPVIVSTHPRTRKRIETLGLTFAAGVRLMKPLGFIDYVRLQSDARAVLSDSGTITEESSLLNFPALNLRDTHERPEGVEEGAVMMVGLSIRAIA